MCPRCRPPRPRLPIVGIFRRGGLHVGRHTTPNRDLTVPNRGLTAPDRDLTASKRRGNCTNRGATRRRHADRMLLMVQNPHSPAGIPPPRAADSPTRRGGRNRIGGMNRIGRRPASSRLHRVRTPNHPGRSAPGRCSTPDRRPLARRAAHKPPRITPNAHAAPALRATVSLRCVESPHVPPAHVLKTIDSPSTHYLPSRSTPHEAPHRRSRPRRPSPPSAWPPVAPSPRPTPATNSRAQ